MAAEKGNKYAESWTLDKTVELVKKAYEVVDEETFFISSIADKCNVYRELFQYLLKKFNHEEKVFLTIKRMYNKAESILFEGAASGKIDKTIAIFALKSLHGLCETTNQNLSIDIPPPPQRAFDDYERKYNESIQNQQNHERENEQGSKESD